MTTLLLIGSGAFASAAAEEALPVGFLEYLGSMVETDGELIDGMKLGTPVENILLQEIRKDGKSNSEKSVEEGDHE